VINDVVLFVKAFENFGIAGLIVWCLYKLADKWAPQFLEAQQATSKAMTELASAVRSSAEEQRETLIAVRVLARQQGDMKEMLETLIARGTK
jgi:hypothetical protein